MIKLLMSLFSVWLSMACAPSEGAEGGITSLTAAEFEALLARDQAVQLVDVRRPDEFAAGHINGAQLIDVTVRKSRSTRSVRWPSIAAAESEACGRRRCCKRRASG